MGKATLAVSSSKGEKSINLTFTPTRKTPFRLLFVRIHFSAGDAPVADLTMTLDAATGDEYNTQLFVFKNRGVGADVFMKFDSSMAWVFRNGDGLKFTWTCPTGTQHHGVSKLAIRGYRTIEMVDTLESNESTVINGDNGGIECIEDDTSVVRVDTVQCQGSEEPPTDVIALTDEYLPAHSG